MEAEQRSGVGLVFGWCCGVGKDTRIRIDGARCGHTGVAGKPGGGVARKAKGAIGSVTFAEGESGRFEGFLPGREIFSGSRSSVGKIGVSFSDDGIGFGCRLIGRGCWLMWRQSKTNVNYNDMLRC